MEKRLYKVKVLNFVPYGGKVIVYYRWAYSEEQVKLIVAKKFNSKYGFIYDNYVDMKVELIKRKRR